MILIQDYLPKSAQKSDKVGQSGCLWDMVDSCCYPGDSITDTCIGSRARSTIVLGSILQAREVGDGNLNFVYIVEGPQGGLVVKQALPFLRLVGDNWPLGQVSCHPCTCGSSVGKSPSRVLDPDA